MSCPCWDRAWSGAVRWSGRKGRFVDLPAVSPSRPPGLARYGPRLGEVAKVPGRPGRDQLSAIGAIEGLDFDAEGAVRRPEPVDQDHEIWQRVAGW